MANEYKQYEEKSTQIPCIPQEMSKGTPCPLVFYGDEKVAKNSVKRLYSKEQLECWYEDLKKSCPKVPEGILVQTLDHYSTNPEVFDQIVSEHKEDPLRFMKNEPLKYEI